MFRVSVTDGRGLVAAGYITRVVVERERFLDRARDGSEPTQPPTTPEPVPVPDRARVRRWSRIVTRGLALVGVLLVVGAIGVYASVRSPTDTLNGFLSDLKAQRDAHAWTQLCEADQREVPQSATSSPTWQRRRAPSSAP